MKIKGKCKHCTHWKQREFPRVFGKCLVVPEDEFSNDTHKEYSCEKYISKVE